MYIWWAEILEHFMTVLPPLSMGHETEHKCSLLPDSHLYVWFIWVCGPNPIGIHLYLSFHLVPRYCLSGSPSVTSFTLAFCTLLMYSSLMSTCRPEIFSYMLIYRDKKVSAESSSLCHKQLPFTEGSSMLVQWQMFQTLPVPGETSCVCLKNVLSG